MEWSFAAVMLTMLSVDLHAIDRFPPLPEVAAARKFNRAYRRYLEGERALDPAHYEDYDDLFIDVDQRYRCWDALDSAYMSLGYPLNYRDWLEQLRGMIGETDFMRGVLPAPVDFTTFRETR